FIALARGGDDPADAERLPTRGANLDRHLVGRPADAPRADFDRRHDVFERLLENRNRILLRLPLDEIERAVDDALGHRLLAGAHDHVHELRDHEIPVLRIGVDLSLLGTMAAGHRSFSIVRSAPGFFRAIHVLPLAIAGSLRSPAPAQGGRITSASLLRIWSAF